MKLVKVADGPFAYEPGAYATYNGEVVAPGRLSHAIMGLLMSAAGEVVRWEDFAAITLAADKRNSVKVTVHYLRKRLAEMGAPAGVIQTVQGHGLRWNKMALPHHQESGG